MKIKTLEIEALLKSHNKKQRHPVTVEDFINHAKRYIKAVNENRMLCSIDSVSSSGMSRSMRFFEMSGKGKTHYLYNFYSLFCILGFTQINNSDSFRIHGCGMDMVFHTNYTIIHDLYRLGFMTKKQCGKLSQNTPHKV
jgi:hypothetical protein